MGFSWRWFTSWDRVAGPDLSGVVVPQNTKSVAIGYTRGDEIRESEESIDVSGVAVYVAAVLGGAWVCFAAAL